MYLDPGFGGMLLQVIVLIAAVGGGILFAIRRKIRRLFSKDENVNDVATSELLQTEGLEDDAVDVLED